MNRKMKWRVANDTKKTPKNTRYSKKKNKKNNATKNCEQMPHSTQFQYSRAERNDVTKKLSDTHAYTRKSFAADCLY